MNIASNSDIIIPANKAPKNPAFSNDSIVANPIPNSTMYPNNATMNIPNPVKNVI